MHCSLNDRKIVNPGQMPKRLVAKPLCKRAEKLRKESIILMENNIGEMEKLKRLERKLRGFVTNSLLHYTSDEYLQMEMNGGQFMYGDRAYIDIGRPNQCHKNAIELYELNKDVASIVTGWAWIQHDLWVQHTWLIHYLDSKRETYEVVETTLKRNAYYGVILSPEEARQFIHFCYS